MLAKITDANSGKSETYLVMCIYDNGKSLDYELMNPTQFWGPHRFAAHLVSLIDEYIPSTWTSLRTKDGVCITSFPEWACDDHFLNYIFENDYYIEEGSRALTALQREYDALLQYYVIKYAGSEQRLRERLSEARKLEEENNSSERGWEIQGTDVNPNTPIKLENIADLYIEDRRGD